MEKSTSLVPSRWLPGTILLAVSLLALAGLLLVAPPTGATGPVQLDGPAAVPAPLPAATPSPAENLSSAIMADRPASPSGISQSPASGADHDPEEVVAQPTVPPPMEISLQANPVSILADGLSTSTLTANVQYLGDGPVEDGTVVIFTTTLGTFPGGVTTTLAPTGTQLIEAESGDTTKVGVWVPYNDPLASGGGGIYSNGTGDRVTYAFTGTAVSVIFQKQFNAGIARIYLDGQHLLDINTFWDDGSGTGKLYQQEEPIASNLPYTPHVIEVEVAGIVPPGSTGAYVVADAFRIYGTDRSGAYLTTGGVATITLTSATTPGNALVTACAGYLPFCDSAGVRFYEPWGGFIYLPIIQKNYPLLPPEPPSCYPYLIRTTSVQNTPHGVAVNEAAGQLYVANHESDSLSVIDASTYAVHATAAVGDGPNGVVYNPANDLVYVANANAGSVTVLQTASFTPVASIDVGTEPGGIAVNAVTNRVYVANFGDGTVSIINGATNTVARTVAVGAEPAMIAVNPLTNKAYVALHGAGKAAVIDGAGNATQISLHSTGPFGITVDTVRNLVYVATIDDYRIVVVDGSTDTFLGWAAITRLPGGEPVPLRMIGVNPSIGTSGHIFLTTAGEDGGWNKFLLLPKGWDEYFARAHALDLNEPREGMAFDSSTLRVFVTSRSDDLVAAYQDGEPTCPNNFGALAGYAVTVCIGNADGSCREMRSR